MKPSAYGNCHNIAAVESCNHSLKAEAIHSERFAIRAQTQTHR